MRLQEWEERVVTRAAIGVGEDEIRQVGFSEQTVNS